MLASLSLQGVFLALGWHATLTGNGRMHSDAFLCESPGSGRAYVGRDVPVHRLELFNLEVPKDRDANATASIASTV